MQRLESPPAVTAQSKSIAEDLQLQQVTATVHNCFEISAQHLQWFDETAAAVGGTLVAQEVLKNFDGCRAEEESAVFICISKVV